MRQFLFHGFLSSLICLSFTSAIQAIPVSPTPETELANSDVIVLARWDPLRAKGLSADIANVSGKIDILVSKVVFGSMKPGINRVELESCLHLRPAPAKKNAYTCWEFIGSSEHHNGIDFTQEQLWFLKKFPGNAVGSTYQVSRYDWIQLAELEPFFATLRTDSKAVRRLLTADSAEVRFRTFSHMKKQSEDFTDQEISRCYWDSNPSIRESVADYLATHPRTGSRETLVRYLQDEEEAVRTAAILALIERRDSLAKADLAKACHSVTHRLRAAEIIRSLDDWKEQGLVPCYLAFAELDEWCVNNDEGDPTTPAILCRDSIYNRTSLWIPLNRTKASNIYDLYQKGRLPQDSWNRHAPSRSLRGTLSIGENGLLKVRLKNLTQDVVALPRLPTSVWIETTSRQEVTVQESLWRDDLRKTDFRTISAGDQLEFTLTLKPATAKPAQVELVYLWRGAEFGFDAWQGTLPLEVAIDE